MVKQPDQNITIGIDLGGTNMRAASFVGLSSMAEGLREEEPSRIDAQRRSFRELLGEPRDPETVVGRLAELVRKLGDACSNTAPIPVGVGIAGMLTGGDGDVAQSPHLKWNNVPFGAMLRQTLGEKYRVVVANDVNAITVAEARFGAARGHQNVLAVFFGTGIGGGALCQGELLTGATNCAVEVGHCKVVLNESARLCACGKRGCAEAYAGGEAIIQRARTELSSATNTSSAVALAGSAKSVNPGHLDAAARDGDPYALGLFAEIAPIAGAAVANAATLLNPSCLVLGGGVLAGAPFLREQIAAAIEIAINPPAAAGLKIVDSQLGDNAGLLGSALLAIAADRLE